jgi:hypothetical protein
MPNSGSDLQTVNFGTVLSYGTHRFNGKLCIPLPVWSANQDRTLTDQLTMVPNLITLIVDLRLLEMQLLVGIYRKLMSQQILQHVVYR